MDYADPKERRRLRKQILDKRKASQLYSMSNGKNILFIYITQFEH